MSLYAPRMRTVSLRAALPALVLVIAGCASRPLPKYEKPIARTPVQSVRTTAYTHTEDDHRAYGTRNALGSELRSDQIHSAAADWSRWPAGTIFRIRETGELYRVDDYGWALSGTNTIDLYKPSRSAMNAWGVRRVTIENLQWGDPHRSLAVLKGRAKYKHVRRMIDEFAHNDMTFPPLTPEPQPVQVALSAPQPAAIPVARATAISTQRAIAVQPPRAEPVARTTTSSGPMKPFYDRAVR